MTPPILPEPSKPTGTMSPAARYFIAIVLLGFSGSWGIAIVKQKDSPTAVDAAIILVPLVLAFAAAVPSTFTFVVSTVKPLWPFKTKGDT